MRLRTSKPTHLRMQDPNAAFELARSLVTAQMARQPNVAGTAKTLTKLRQLADTDWQEVKASAARNNITVACREGCSFCCREPVSISLLEAVVLAGYVGENFSEEQRRGLAERGFDYRKRRREGTAKVPCPFLIDDRCSIYEQRPLMCRGVHSIDPSVCEERLSGGAKVRPCAQIYAASCEAMMDGLSMGVPGRSFADSFELGVMAERIARGAVPEAYVLEALCHKPLPDLKPDDPTGVSEGIPPQFAPYVQQRDAANLEAAFASLAKSDASTRRLLEFNVPLAYESSEEADAWWEKSQSALRTLEESEVDARAVFGALQFHTTFPFGYADRDMADVYGRFGAWLLDRVFTPLFPDLVEPFDKPRRPGPLRVGYLSPDLANKNGTRWSIGWLESHGPEVETYAINIAYLEDQVTQRFMRSATHYVSVPIDVPRAARAIRALDLDLLIYPEIGQNGRAVQFASMRLARVQATGWGYPATSGLPNIDFYLSGEDMHATDGEYEFTETLHRLPGTGLVMDNPHHPPGTDVLPDLPADFLLMGQNLVKLHPKWDSLWAELSQRSKLPILMVHHPNPEITAKTMRRLEKAGVHVQWLPFLTYNQFEKLLIGATASLDTQVWSGGYTAFQAMQVGTPLVTLPGHSMRSRMSTAFLKQAGGESLITRTPQEYIEVACDLERLREARRSIQKDAVYGSQRVPAALRLFLEDVVAPRCGF